MNRRSGWVIEGAANLCAQQDKVADLIHEWATAHDLTDTGEVHVGGRRLLKHSESEDFDSIVLTLPATPEQAQQLACLVAEAFNAPMYTREAELVGIPVLDMRTMQPTGEMSWVDLEIVNRSENQRRGPSPRELN